MKIRPKTKTKPLKGPTELIRKFMSGPPQQKTDVKHSNKLLPKSVPASGTSPIAQSGRKSDVKEDVTLTTTSSSPSPGSDVAKILSSLKIDLSKLDPQKDAAAIKAAESTVGYLLSTSSRSGSADGNDLKHFYNAFSATIGTSGTIPATSTIVSLNYPVFSGNTLTTRLGRVITNKHVRLRFLVEWVLISNDNSGNIHVTGPPALRLIVFRDKQALAAAPTTFTILSGPPYNPTSPTDVLMSLINQNQASTMPFNPSTHGYRYHIYRDEVHHAPANSYCIYNGASLSSYGQEGHATENFEMLIPLDFESEYADDSTSGSTQDLSNELNVMYLVDASTSAGWNISLSFQTDLTFKDA